MTSLTRGSSVKTEFSFVVIVCIEAHRGKNDLGDVKRVKQSFSLPLKFSLSTAIPMLMDHVKSIS